MKKIRTKHGLSGPRNSRAYLIWMSMRSRCNNAAHKNFNRYGGRGITVCERWGTFENFLADMGDPPKGETIERNDNDGNYEPGNCCWATRKTQANNTIRNHFLTAFGHTLTIAEWSEKTGMNEATLRHRIKLGWSTEKVLTAKNRYSTKPSPMIPA